MTRPPSVLARVSRSLPRLVALVALLGGASAPSLACTPQGDTGIGPEGYSDNFDRAQLGQDWNVTGGPWRIVDGALRIREAHNHPLWLRRTLPRDVRVEFDATSTTHDIKVELFGDGVSHALGDAYTATSYVVIFGGWGNQTNVLARMDEHADDRVVGTPRRVEANRTYHFVIERRGSVISVDVDGERLLTLDDPEPLQGRGHDHFGFNNWESDVTFDNLRIQPL
ncbi:MAG: hypothetical protein KC593_21940 [Myxococcales bacterium]|nr:hypothetical protein [Myxococcales bacterium]MCB9628288.1 hypothetical protein [Sandaracinaceae bacterium]